MHISVALCTYNGEKYLMEQLDSIANQTVSVNEIVICDDGSKERINLRKTKSVKKYDAFV